MTTKTLKIHFSNENIRVLTLTQELSSFDEFSQFLIQNYKKYLNGEILIQYHDQDGDLISVSSQLEWEEMIQYAGDRISIFVKTIQQQQPGGYHEDFSRGFGYKRCPRVPRADCPRGFGFRRFPRGFIIRTESNTTEENNSHQKDHENTSGKPEAGNQFGGFFKLNPKQKIWLLHNKALTLMSIGDHNSLFKAKDILLEILTHQSNDPIVYYNLACVESLIGNVDQAISYLKISISEGYNDYLHMIEDPDFNNIRNSEGYRECLQSISPKENQNQEVPKNESNDENATEISTAEPEIETPVEPITEPEIETPVEPEPITVLEIESPVETGPIEIPETESQDLFPTIRNIILEMGINLEEEKLKALCNQFSNDITQILREYLRSL
jgi:hypothetical protein